MYLVGGQLQGTDKKQEKKKTLVNILFGRRLRTCLRGPVHEAKEGRKTGCKKKGGEKKKDAGELSRGGKRNGNNRHSGLFVEENKRSQRYIRGKRKGKKKNESKRG